MAYAQHIALILLKYDSFLSLTHSLCQVTQQRHELAVIAETAREAAKEAWAVAAAGGSEAAALRAELEALKSEVNPLIYVAPGIL